MADGYRYPQQSSANYYYPQSTQPQHPRHQIIRNSTPPNNARSPFSIDTPSPSRSPDSQSPAHNVYGMYNPGHQQGQHGRVNGGGRGMQQHMGMYGGFQHQNSHQQHPQHHGAIQQDTHPTNGSAMGHHTSYSSGVLSSQTPNFVPSSLQNGHSATRPQANHNEHWIEQLKLRQISQEANATMIDNHQPHWYARTKAHDNRAVASHYAVQSLLATHESRQDGADDDVPEERTRRSNFADLSVLRRQEWTSLDMSGQGLRVLTGVFRYRFITELYIASNKITELPADIGMLRSMVIFDASNNQLRSLPGSLGMCSFLKTILLFDNQIQNLPVEFGYLFQLQMLGIEGNPIEENIKTEIMERGTTSLINQLRENAPVPMPPPPREVIDLSEGGSPPLDQDRFKVFSYNILCDNATREQYNYTPSAALSWDFRKAQVLQEITAQNADIVCLQEVDITSFSEFFSPQLAYHNLKGAFWPKARAKTMTEENAKVVDGCATFYRHDRYMLLDKQLIDFSHTGIHDMKMRGEGASDFFNRVMGKDQMAVMVFLENRRTGSRLVIVNGHLFWDPAYPDVKLIQTAILMDSVSRFTERYAKWEAAKDKRRVKMAEEGGDSEAPPEYAPSMQYESRTQIPMVLCLDLNSTPDSSAYEFLSQGQIRPSHEDLQGFKYGPFSENGMDHSFSLRSAYSVLEGQKEELKFTNYTPGFEGVIDHIFYTTNSLEAVKLLGGVDDEYMKMVPGFPNYHFPSDHLSLMTEFVVKPRKEKKALPEPDFGSSSRRREQL